MSAKSQLIGAGYNAQVGYVVTDIDSGYDQLNMNRLRDIRGTIRSRILF